MKVNESAHHSGTAFKGLGLYVKIFNSTSNISMLTGVYISKATRVLETVYLHPV